MKKLRAIMHEQDGEQYDEVRDFGDGCARGLVVVAIFYLALAATAWGCYAIGRWL